MTRTIVFILLSVVNAVALLALEREVLFENISNKDGLSHSTVFTICQDNEGYMWIGTQNGLNRYDGFRFKNYKSGQNTLSSSYIRTLFIDWQGTLWVGGDKGLSYYDTTLDVFVNYQLFKTRSDNCVSSVTQTSDGTIWVATMKGNIYKRSFSEIDFSPLNNKFASGQKYDGVNVLLSMGNKLLIGTNSGLFLLTEDGKDSLLLNTNNHPARAIVFAEDSTVWIGADGGGIYQLDRDFKVIRHRIYNVSDNNSLCDDRVRSLCFDDEGKLWVGTFVGLSIYDVEEDQFSTYNEDFSRPFALVQNSIRSLFKDTQGGMWLGTFYGGLDYYHPDNIKFNILNQNGGTLSLTDNVISGIKEDEKGNFWILTNDKGLNYWDREKSVVVEISHNKKDVNSLTSNNLKSIVFSPQGNLLIGTHASGLNYLDLKTWKNMRFMAGVQPYDLSDNSVYALLKDSENRIWVGTWKGLNRFDEKTLQFSQYYIDAKRQRLSSDQISYLYEDSRKRIWVGTFSGINIFYPEKNVFETLSLQTEKGEQLHEEITSVYEDSKGRIWLTTRCGVGVFDEIERRFVALTTKDGLANDLVYGVLEDGFGNLWFSTNSGLSCYNSENKSFKNFTESDGIQSSQFNNYAFCKSSDGSLFFGGINGITYFDPKRIKPTSYPLKITFTDFYLGNNVVLPGDENAILTKSINLTKELTLKHEQNVFAIGFTAIDFIDAEKTRFYYLLEGYDDQWQKVGAGQTAYYSNIMRGRYTFKIYAVNSEGNLKSAERQIRIWVKAPWWWSTVAIVFYVLIIGLILIFTFILFRQRFIAQQQLELERLKKNKLEEVNQLKLQFFTNISHEFRTPLTLIISPLQKMIKRRSSDEWLNKQLEITYRNARRLVRMVDQLLDFRRSEFGQLKLKVAHGELVSFVNEIYLSFTVAASDKNIVYTFDTQEEKINCYFDAGFVEKIVFNLLSNAFKYTTKGGMVGLRLYTTNEWIVMEVKDSGKGIAEEKKAMIFERFYRVEESSREMGSGIGLALTKRLVDTHHGEIAVKSELNKGSLFMVKMPRKSGVYSQDEMAEESETQHVPSEIVREQLRKEEEVSDKTEDNKALILIVEDNHDIIEYIKDSVKNRYDVSIAHNGKEALEKVGHKEPDLIISDVMMPEMDGFTLCKTLKQNIRTCHIPVILLTAKSTLNDQLKGLGTGADDYVVKPFDMEILEAKIDGVIKNRKRIKELYAHSGEINTEAVAFNDLDKEFLDRAITIVEEHMTDTVFSVNFFAREMGMSRSNLHLKMKAIAGISATDFIKKIRFNLAVKLIEEKRHSISEVSYMVGFNSPSYFSTSFKKHFGYLPTEHLEKGKQM